MPRALHSRSPAVSDPHSDLPTVVRRSSSGLGPSAPVLQVRRPMASYGVSFAPVATAVHVLGVLVLALILYWVIAFRGGVTLWGSAPALIFNVRIFSLHHFSCSPGWIRNQGLDASGLDALTVVGFLSKAGSELQMEGFVMDLVAHPVIMFGGFIFVSSEAILVYKTLSGTKRSKKLVHMSLQAIAFLLALVGIWAALKFHLDSNIDNFYSLHSWLGIFTVVLFFIQWIAGFFSFWTQSVAGSTRAAVLPWHVFFGIGAYVLAVATAVLGFLEKITFLQSGSLGHYASEAMFVNTVALLVVVFGFVTVLAILIPAPKEEDGYQAIE
ncbi:hypothetical protein AXG93_1154s1510 [Marchantia polymorpha subsp. ruderalis]|uniref:Cytochrome b561 domain-containing protein n=1 Tax=Marchantia polymorpha subsp. ruderalis TaxID=1480154 RepID=A0A176WRF4_MARPO|nr:hypothetical protein AXG93_1154s1510 [Marchantia polymorpha subsp. ruderalis]